MQNIAQIAQITFERRRRTPERLLQFFKTDRAVVVNHLVNTEQPHFEIQTRTHSPAIESKGH